MSTPDVTAEGIEGMTALVEQENTARIGGLLRQGVSPDRLQMLALTVRLELLVESLPLPPVFELEYENRVALVLDQYKANIKPQSKLVLP